MAIGLLHDPIFQKHDPGSFHVESPQRLVGIDQALSQWPGVGSFELTPLRQAGEDELLRVHRSDHLARIAATDGRSVSLDPDTSTSPDSCQVALTAAGSLLNLCDAVISGEVQNGLALIRPPGHHATASRSMGFCLFNNVAVATAHLIRARGLKRVMIVDWDVHHGNGTEDIFFADDSVLYFSVHQAPFYPGSGPVTSVGHGAGLGYTCNVPLNGGHDDISYVHIFEGLVAPLGRAFKPEAIIVSAGFDAHRDDPLGGMRVSSAGYGAMTAVLMDLAAECCPGRLILALEGGYSPTAMGRAVVEVSEALSGNPQQKARECVLRREPPKGLAKALELAGMHWNLG